MQALVVAVIAEHRALDGWQAMLTPRFRFGRFATFCARKRWPRAGQVLDQCAWLDLREQQLRVTPTWTDAIDAQLTVPYPLCCLLCGCGHALHPRVALYVVRRCT